MPSSKMLCHKLPVVTLAAVLSCISMVASQSFEATGCRPGFLSTVQVLAGSFGTIGLLPGDSCSYRIEPSGDPTMLVLRLQDGATSTAQVLYCSTAACDAQRGRTLAADEDVQLLPSDYPAGIWLNVTLLPTTTTTSNNGGGSSTVQFSTVSGSCSSDPGFTPLLLYQQPPDSDRALRPSYSLCVPSPNNHPDFGLSFSWSWSFATLPRSLAGGFYALLPSFRLVLPLGVYDINLVKATPPTPSDSPMQISLSLMAGNGTALATFTDSETGFFVPSASRISLASMVFYVPAGMGDQTAAVYTVRHVLPTPPSSPARLQEVCAAASSPYQVQYGSLAATIIRMPYNATVPGFAGGVTDPTSLIGGCAFRFPATTPTGDIMARHSLLLSPASPGTAQALAWLAGSPTSSQALLGQGSAAAFVTATRGRASDALTVLLSGGGSGTSPVVVEYMAELSACAGDNAVPLHFIAKSPLAADKLTLSMCKSAPDIISDGTDRLLDFGLDWDVSDLPSVFSDPAGFRVELRNSSFSRGQRLPRGWYRVVLLKHSSISLTLTIGNIITSTSTTIFLSQGASTMSLVVKAPLTEISRTMGAAVRIMSMAWPPPNPTPPMSPPSQPSPPPPSPPRPSPPRPSPPRPSPPSPSPPRPSPPSPSPPRPSPPSPPFFSPSPNPSSPNPSSPSPSSPSPSSPSPSTSSPSTFSPYQSSASPSISSPSPPSQPLATVPSDSSPSPAPLVLPPSSSEQFVSQPRPSVSPVLPTSDGSNEQAPASPPLVAPPPSPALGYPLATTPRYPPTPAPVYGAPPPGPAAYPGPQVPPPPLPRNLPTTAATPLPVAVTAVPSPAFPQPPQSSQPPTDKASKGQDGSSALPLRPPPPRPPSGASSNSAGRRGGESVTPMLLSVAFGLVAMFLLSVSM